MVVVKRTLMMTMKIGLNICPGCMSFLIFERDETSKAAVYHHLFLLHWLPPKITRIYDVIFNVILKHISKVLIDLVFGIQSTEFDSSSSSKTFNMNWYLYQIFLWCNLKNLEIQSLLALHAPLFLFCASDLQYVQSYLLL